MHIRSVDYARSIINMAGYRIKRVKLELYGPNSRLGGLDQFYKVAKDGESWEQFLKRYGLAANDNGPPGFNIVIEVEPHPGALRKMAANDNVPTSTRPPRPPGTKTAKLPRTDTEPMSRPPASNDNFGGSPPPSDGPPVGQGGGDEPLYMARVAQLRQQAEQQAQEALARYRAHQQGNLQLTPDELDNIFWAIRDRDNLQGGLELAVSTARRAGVPDDVIAQHVGAYANSLQSNTQMHSAVRAIERAHLQKNGYRVLALGDTEAEMINRIVINTQGGRASAEELAFLRQRIAAAEARGRDYFDDLARTGSMTSDEPFELLANADEIKRLRALAEREDLYSGTSRTGSEATPSPPRQQEGRPSPEVTNRSREETRTMGRPDPSGGTQRFPLDMPPSAEAEMRRRLRTLDPLSLQHALRTAGAMQKLGVPEELARELVALNAVRLANPGTQSLNRVIQAQLVAQGILEHGTRVVTLKKFAQAIGVPKSIAEVAAEVAAIRSGYAPLPSEIRPGWLYPAYR